MAVSALKVRFQERDYSVYANMEQLLTKACSKIDYSPELQEVTDFSHKDFNKSELESHLQLLSCMEVDIQGDYITFSDIHRHFQSLPKSHSMLLSQVARLVKFVLLVPATNAVSERSASVMHAKNKDVLTYYYDSVAFKHRYDVTHS